MLQSLVDMATCKVTLSRPPVSEYGAHKPSSRSDHGQGVRLPRSFRCKASSEESLCAVVEHHSCVTCAFWDAWACRQ
jgi:hypothetical protein